MRTRTTAGGFTLIEVMVAIVLFGLALAVYATMAASSADRNLETLAAQHMRQVSDAAERYVSDNNATLAGLAGPSTAYSFGPSTLQSAGYLPPQFVLTSPYRQTYEIRVLEPTAGQLSTLILTTGGDTIGEGSLRRIARQVGAIGGYVSSSNTNVATGVFGGWTQTLSTYGATITAGHLASSLFFKDGQQVSDYLYRSTVAGHPEMNQMAAPLDMANNNITNAGQVSAVTVASSGRITASEFVQLQSSVTVGASCASNGLLGRESDGRLASCVSGTWRRAGY